MLQSKDIELKDLAARCPDQNPTEHVWDILLRRLKARRQSLATILELWLAL